MPLTRLQPPHGPVWRMTTLVTGASGFVGGHLRAHMKCVTLQVGGARVDIRGADAMQAAVHAVVTDAKVDSVIHLAAQSAVPASFDDPRGTLDVNLGGTLNLLQALDAAQFRGALLYVGSGQIYGDVPEARLPIAEDTVPRPTNPYAVSKLAGEALCAQWSLTSAYRIVLARPFNHLGAGQSRKFSVSDFAAQIAEIELGKRPHRIEVGDISVTRDLTDVADVVTAYALLLERGRNGEAYNVCSGREYALRTVLERLLTLAGVEATIEERPDRFRPSDQRRLVASHAKLTRETGWSPQRPLDDSLRDLLTHWRTTLRA
jgi:GDP-4-dehydro-6-deoxy-D-mannose reductase